jgi:formylglycine-generating enzyme required for sulfatase activity
LARKAGDVEVVNFFGTENIELVWCPPGSFLMGSPSNETGRFANEVQHTVALTKGFWIGKYEVTQGQWERMMGNNPSYFKGARNPVERVSWNDCQDFISILNTLTEGQVSRSCFTEDTPRAGLFRLPMEGEWEYACRAGTTGMYAGALDEMGWYNQNSGSTTHPVGQKSANSWGLYDMHGNVLEWCQDWYGDYPTGIVTDPTGPCSGSFRVYRGGSWILYARDCRSADRFRIVPGYRSSCLGLRLVRNHHEP